jgi:hypothetical protein
MSGADVTGEFRDCSLLVDAFGRTRELADASGTAVSCTEAVLARVPRNAVLKRFALIAGACSVIGVACTTRSNIGSDITVENIRRINIGMPRSEVERVLGVPLRIEPEDSRFNNTVDVLEVMVYFRRLPPPLKYPMLWVHLRDGKVSEVYAKRHDIFDSWGVYGLTASRKWEAPEFTAIFPISGQQGRR